MEACCSSQSVLQTQVRYIRDSNNKQLTKHDKDIYIASRTLYGLARDGQAPSFFKKTRAGVPVFAVGFTSLFICLALLNVSTSSATAFSYFVSVSTVLGLLNWVALLIAYFSLLRGMKSQGLSRRDMPWRGPLQPYGAYVAFVITIIVIVTNGWQAFLSPFQVPKFITSYIGVVVFLINVCAWKFIRGTKRVRAAAMDLDTGRLMVNEETEMEHDVAQSKKSFVTRLAGAVWGR